MKRTIILTGLLLAPHIAHAAPVRVCAPGELPTTDAPENARLYDDKIILDWLRAHGKMAPL